MKHPLYLIALPAAGSNAAEISSLRSAPAAATSSARASDAVNNEEKKGNSGGQEPSQPGPLHGKPTVEQRPEELPCVAPAGETVRA